MNKYILKTLGLALLSTALANCDGSDKHSDTSQATYTDQSGRIAKLEGGAQQSLTTIQRDKATIEQQGATIVQITQTQKDAETASTANAAEAKAALAELQKKFADNPTFDPAKQQAIRDDLDALKVQFDANLKFDPEALKGVQASLEKLRAQFDASPKFDPKTVQDLGDAVARLAKLVDSALDANPVRLALRRLLPNHYQQITWVNTMQPNVARDSFRIYGKQGAITIEGTSPAVILTGLKEYLKQAAHVSIGWPGDSLDMLPKDLPAPTQEIKGAASVSNRFALNDTDDGYSDAYKSWPEWERKIDLLAMNGINEVFIPVGTEEVYRQTFQQFGYSDDEIRNWIPAPAHQPWWLLQNMAGFNSPVPPSLYARRVETGKKIVARMKEFGMTPVLPGYFGTVPTKFKDKNPAALLVAQGGWAGGFQRPDWLDPRSDLFKQIAATFYQKQTALFGATTMYKMDLLHEGGNPGTVPIAAAGQAVGDALHNAHPGAIWVLLGWQDNPPQAVLQSQKVDQVLIVDGLSAESNTARNRESQWLSRPYSFGMINNFGGNTSIGARGSVWLTRFFDALNKSGTAMNGVAYLPEGTGNDPAAFDLFTELAWRAQKSDQPTWFGDYSTYRYGGSDVHAANAWKIIGGTAYSITLPAQEPQDSLFAARPSLSVNRSREWAPSAPEYDMAAFAKALPELLQVVPNLRTTSAYRHDLVDLTRQVLDNRARILLPKINSAYIAKDKVRFAALTGVWLDYMKALDDLLATSPDFLLGNFLAGARASASNDAEVAQFLYDQRSILTTWTNTDGDLHDYANRELSGLVSGLYAVRWNAYFTSLSNALASNTAPTSVNWFAMEDAWAKKVEATTTTPVGDTFALAQGIADKIASEPN